MKCFLSPVLCIWLSNEGIKTLISFIFKLLNLFFGKQRGFTIKVKHEEMLCDHSIKNKVLIILVVL